MVAIAIINQRIQVVRSFEVDTATSAPIPTIRPTKRYKLLTTEVTGTISTITRLHIDFCIVIKHDVVLMLCFFEKKYEHLFHKSEYITFREETPPFFSPFTRVPAKPVRPLPPMTGAWPMPHQAQRRKLPRRYQSHSQCQGTIGLSWLEQHALSLAACQFRQFVRDYFVRLSPE